VRRHLFEWQNRSLFSVPLNAHHRLVNAASAPALLLCGTSAPNVMNLIDNTDFIFNRPVLAQISTRLRKARTFSRAGHAAGRAPLRAEPFLNRINGWHASLQDSSSQSSSGLPSLCGW
jgi:hypothetical protein